MITCKGPQTGQQIREDVKQLLIEYAGWEENWIVNWVTDNEAKQVNARDPTKHQLVGMKTNWTGSCVDHTFELAVEETLKQTEDINIAVSKLRTFVNYIKDSSSAREKFHEILNNAGVDSLTIIQGTSNRWFFKYAEVKRGLILKDHIDFFFEEYDIPPSLSGLEQEDWKLLIVYENSLRLVVEAAKTLSYRVKCDTIFGHHLRGFKKIVWKFVRSREKFC